MTVVRVIVDEVKGLQWCFKKVRQLHSSLRGRHACEWSRAINAKLLHCDRVHVCCEMELKEMQIVDSGSDSMRVQ